MFEKVGTYYYFFPTYNQGKKILWNGIDKDGFKFLDHIPHELRKRTDKTEMLIETINGSIFQIIGTDNVDSIVGTNPIGCVFSEYALQDPIAWGYIRPILEENGGWAVFNYTSRGKNHGYTLKKFAEMNDDWFVHVLPATETKVFTEKQLAKERAQYIMEDGDDLRFQQEYMCSFKGSMRGSYYGTQMEKAEKDNRITRVPYEPTVKVDTFWDLGIADSMAVWFTQTIGKEVRVIDYYQVDGEGFPFMAKILSEKGYAYGIHFAPHDIKVRELGSGVSRKETAAKLGINFSVVPNIGIEDGIQAVRLILNKCWFDEEKCDKGLECLRQYHKEWDDKGKIFKSRPHHDWSSHGADAFRMLAVGYSKLTKMSGNQFNKQNKSSMR